MVLQLLKQTVLFTEEDEKYLRQAGEVLADQITATIKPFLAKKGHSLDDVEKMYQAWFKSVVLQVTLWCYPYVKDGDF
ncbi:hypothetical protein PCC6912_17790 [Chlorogloeopsis fritschii PCC 6912]|uniref:Globin-sensor domain-containing protein n=2 Tax=Chlorogloeopsis fritschii TaxID=1124 RepID=A0A3S0Y4R7_CHLFR|nr:protoglobin domain-containing protein [Chlorogloeopsis fritschii]RUR84185.1 hypothetical protein PCC6912_17790 [Chlorogloeopsis fritschii PCC 6912]